MARSTHEGSREDLLANLESLFDAGAYPEVVALAESLLSRAGSDYFHGKVRLRLAQAYMQQGKPDVAKTPLAEAKRRFETIGDAEMIVECMAAEASIACTEQRPEALELATETLRRCRSLNVVPAAVELAILSSMASSQLLRGQRNDAIETFEEAIALADPVIDMRRLAKLLGNAAIAYRDLGRIHQAITYSTRAVALFETLRDLVSLAREENNLGCYLINSGALSSARTHLERAGQLFEKTSLEKGRGLLLLSLCELCFAQGDLETANGYAAAAIQAGESQHEPWTVADAHLWCGRIAARLGDEARSDAAFQSAVAILERSLMVERLVECHATYAEILERRGDLARAYEHLREAFEIRTSGRGGESTVEIA